MAHLGAIERVRRAGLPIDCVVGNSMGSVVGALYAQAPSQNTTARFRTLLTHYVDTTRADADSSGTGGALLFGLLALASGGTLLAAGLAGGVGYAAGAGGTEHVDHGRMVRVLHRELGEGDLSSLPVPFVTGHAVRDRDGLRAEYSDHGQLADVVGASIANPFIFHDVDVHRTPQLDPGADRVEAVPVIAACQHFPDARLLVVNVTGQESVRLASTHCPVVEVMVDPGTVNQEEIVQGGPEFDRVVRTGYVAMDHTLDP